MTTHERPTVLDLFCGAGGMSLGFANVGYDVIAGVDYDDDAVETYRENFDHEAYQYDLSSVEPEQFSRETGIDPSDVNVVVGGPPCQGFSRANLERSDDDPRNNLVFRFARYVDFYQPRVFVMENVTGIESIDDGETVQLLRDGFAECGYDVQYTTLNAADYGVPQKRKRVFFIGVRDDLDSNPQFPNSTHAPQSELDSTDTRQQTVVADD